MYRRSQRWMLIINNRFLSLYDYNLTPRGSNESCFARFGQEMAAVNLSFSFRTPSIVNRFLAVTSWWILGWQVLLQHDLMLHHWHQSSLDSSPQSRGVARFPLERWQTNRRPWIVIGVFSPALDDWFLEWVFTEDSKQASIRFGLMWSQSFVTRS